MKKTYLGVGILVLLLIIVGVWIMVSKKDAVQGEPVDQTVIQVDDQQTDTGEGSSINQASVDSTTSVKPEMCVINHGKEAFDQILVKATLGSVIQSSEKLDLTKLGLEPVEAGKRVLLTFSNSACSGCQKFYPLFKEWVENFEDVLEVKAVLYGPPSTNDRIKEELITANINTVTTDSLSNLIPAEYEKFESLLIDENGQIVYGLYSFDIPKWKLVKEIVDTFASTGDVLNIVIDHIALGNKLKFPQMTDIQTDQVYKEADFLGKPSIFVVNWPQFRLNNNVYPVITRLYQKYQDQLNFAVVLYDNEAKVGGWTKEYYDTYDTEVSFVDRSIKDINSLIEGQGLTGMPVFFDQEWEFCNYTNLEATPTVVICDKDLKVIDILNLGRCISMAIEGDLTVEKIVQSSFNLK